MIIYIGADHRGFSLKEELCEYLSSHGYDVQDQGNDRYDKDDDFIDFAVKVVEKVQKHGNSARGIVICGSGVGMDIVANKFAGIRSTLSFSPDHARVSRNDDDTNILSLPADFIDKETAKKIVDMWLEQPFSQEDKYVRRINKIKELEREQHSLGGKTHYESSSGN